MFSGSRQLPVSAATGLGSERCNGRPKARSGCLPRTGPAAESQTSLRQSLPRGRTAVGGGCRGGPGTRYSDAQASDFKFRSHTPGLDQWSGSPSHPSHPSHAPGWAASPLPQSTHMHLAGLALWLPAQPAQGEAPRASRARAANRTRPPRPSTTGPGPGCCARE